MDFTPFLALAVVIAAVVASARGVDVRLALFSAALILGALAGDLRPIVRTFLETFSSEKFVVPICTAMGFAYVLKETGCDRDLVRLLIAPVRRVKFLLIPGVIGVGFLVNIPVVSQTSTAVCLGTVVVPILRAAGFSPLAIGSTLLLGASVGGELLNPGAPELLAVNKKTGTPTTVLTQQYLPQLVFPILIVSALVFWVQTRWLERRAGHRDRGSENRAQGSENRDQIAEVREPITWLTMVRAFVPLLPLILLLLAGPPFNVLHIDDFWLAANAAEAKELGGSRLIGLAMIVGVIAAAAACPLKAKGCMKSFFEGAGYGFANIISLIVVAVCFGAGIKQVGLARGLDGFLLAYPIWLHPLAAFAPWLFAFVSGSGMASTQSLYELFYGPAVALNEDANAVGAMVSAGSAVGRTMSPVAAVTLMCGRLTDTKPLDLVKRVSLPLLIGLSTAVVLRLLKWV